MDSWHQAKLYVIASITEIPLKRKEKRITIFSFLPGHLGKPGQQAFVFLISMIK
jgi:hypothetical protein